MVAGVRVADRWSSQGRIAVGMFFALPMLWWCSPRSTASQVAANRHGNAGELPEVFVERTDVPKEWDLGAARIGTVTIVVSSVLRPLSPQPVRFPGRDTFSICC